MMVNRWIRSGDYDRAQEILSELEKDPAYEFLRDGDEFKELTSYCLKNLSKITV